ncbi:unnamed protein product [Ostreobium quekettii]|uniref:Peptidase C14 caspase domain-containing protein n=1 Tax=Ostreobium quekettii TaxID=121088 RepID=A0A8S1IVN8_9CHLO|nr:unnamed protein product [Ostreobium quekettii]|eukprot:evm.model.scf_1507.3 EVM.evm.TU.scf_1507.3   scf_1507:17653-20888(-)
MLQTQFSFLDENIRMMTDDQQGALCPTKSNIFLGFQWLLQGAQAGDKLFLHFSGHGSQQKDQDGDEKDGADETLLPTDYRDAGHILDDEVNERVVNPLPEGVVLHSVIDACHSGTAMDLRYYTKCKRGTFEWKDNYKSPHLARTKGTAGGVAFQFGACKDSEVAQDTAELGGTNSGAATYSFIQAIEFGGRSQSYGQILCRMQRSMDKLKKLREDSAAGGGAGGQLGRWMEKVAAQKQTPQLSCSSKIDLSQPLML